MCYKIVDSLKVGDTINILQLGLKKVDKLGKWPQITDLNFSM